MINNPEQPLNGYSFSFFLMLLFVALFVVSCDDDTRPFVPAEPSPAITLKANEVVSEGYLGNGVQWDPYPQAYRYWNQPISDADWAKVYARLDYMQPKFLRVVFGSYDKYALQGADSYNPVIFFEGLERILQYCQDNDITVMAGDWGYNQVDAAQNRIFPDRIHNAARYLDYLINQKGFTCIDYYNIINEPNLGGSAAQGNYGLYKDASLLFHEKMAEFDLLDEVEIAGPDVAVFNDADITWVNRAERDLGDKIGLYEVHTYPPRSTMLTGAYTELLESYRAAIPADKKAVIGEFGFKYETGDARRDMELADKNRNEINSNPNVSEDSNTLVDEYFQGVDLASLTIKIMNAGYSGAVNWNLDDAMHSGSTSGQDFKVWGFWNILGEELLGKPEAENLRPHFFPYSLLTRYLPDGSRILKTNITTPGGVDVLLAEKDGKFVLAVSNMLDEAYDFELKIEGNADLSGLKKFSYQEDGWKVDGDGFPLPAEEGVSLSAGDKLEVAPVSFTLYTNFDY